MSTEGLKDKAVRGVAWYGSSRVAIQLFSWIMTIAVARVLSPHDYGLLGMALLYMGLVDFLNELGFGVAIVQKKQLQDADLDTLFWFGSCSGLVFYGLTVLVAPLVGSFFGEPLLASLLWLLGVNFLLTGLRTVPWNMLTRAVDFKNRSIAEVVGNMIGAIVTVVLAYSGWGVWALAIGFVVRNLLMTAQVYIQTRWRPRLQFSWSTLQGMMSFSLNVTGSRAAWYAHDNSDRLIIGKLLGGQALGFYSLAMRFTSELMGRVLAVVNQVAFPIYSRLQDEPARLKSYFLTSVELTCALIIPALAGLFLLADDLIPLLLTDKWTPMIPFFKILCWAAILATFHSLANPVVLAKGYSWLSLRFHLLCLAVMPLSFYIGSRLNGLLGVCQVWLIVFPFLVAFWLTRTRKIVGYSWDEFWRTIRPSALATALMLAAGMLVKLALGTSLAPAVRVVILTFLGAATYCACFVALAPHSIKELLKKFRPSKEPSPPQDVLQATAPNVS